MRLTKRKLRSIIREELKDLRESKSRPNEFIADADSSHPINRFYASLNIGPDDISSVYIVPCAPDKTAFYIRLGRGVDLSRQEVEQFKNQYSDILFVEYRGSRVYLTWDGRF
jgi:hypothetical protein